MAPPRMTLRTDEVDVLAEGVWRVRWSVRNESERPLRIYHVLAPHSRFHADEKWLDMELAPGGRGAVELTVECDAQTGSDVENAFLIFEVNAETRDRRVLARLRARHGEDGAPLVLVERIDVQEVGFGGGA